MNPAHRPYPAPHGPYSDAHARPHHTNGTRCSISISTEAASGNRGWTAIDVRRSIRPVRPIQGHRAHEQRTVRQADTVQILDRKAPIHTVRRAIKGRTVESRPIQAGAVKSKTIRIIDAGPVRPVAGGGTMLDIPGMYGGMPSDCRTASGLFCQPSITPERSDVAAASVLFCATELLARRGPSCPDRRRLCPGRSIVNRSAACEP